MSGSIDPEGALDRRYRIAVCFDTGPEAERVEAILEDLTHRYRGVVTAETSGERITRLRAAGYLVDVRADLTAEHAARSETAATDTLPGSDGPQSMLPPLGAGAAGTTDRVVPAPEFVAAALMKAVLVAATRRLPSLRRPHTAQDLGYPDFDQSFGRLDLTTVLPTPDAPADRRLVWADLPDTDPDALEAFADPERTRHGSRTYRLTVPGGPHTDDLRVVLAWTDRPGSAVQNNLDLAVTTPDGTIHVGNEQHTCNKVPGFDRSAVAQLTGLRLDRANTVEAVRIGDPAPGTCTIKVFAQNTHFAAQGYAVCAAGPISEEELTTP